MAGARVRDRISDTLSRHEAARARLMDAQRDYFHGMGSDYDARRQEYVQALRERLQHEDELRKTDPEFEPRD